MGSYIVLALHSGTCPCAPLEKSWDDNGVWRVQLRASLAQMPLKSFALSLNNPEFNVNGHDLVAETTQTQVRYNML